MIFRETELKGAYVIEAEKVADQRGFFARSWCRQEFEKQGLKCSLAQCNISYNHKKGTLRGMHYQIAPRGETKLIRCTAGAIYDVIIDLRPGSATYRQWYAAELSAENYRMLYVPEDFAHGFLTLNDNTEVYYMMSEFYSPEHSRGCRWNDPAFNIRWPGEINVISDRDRTYPDVSI